MGDRQLAEAYCDRVYDKALREKGGGRNWARAAAALSLLAGQPEPGDYDIYLKLVQVGARLCSHQGLAAVSVGFGVYLLRVQRLRHLPEAGAGMQVQV